MKAQNEHPQRKNGFNLEPCLRAFILTVQHFLKRGYGIGGESSSFLVLRYWLPSVTFSVTGLVSEEYFLVFCGSVGWSTRLLSCYGTGSRATDGVA